MQRIKGKKENEGDENDGSDSDLEEDEEGEDEDKENNNDNQLNNNRDEEDNENEDYSSDDVNEEEAEEENKLVLNFEETTKKQEKKESGVFRMKFMKDSITINEKLNKVKNEIDIAKDEDDDESEDGPKPVRPSLKSLASQKEKTLLKGKLNARVKNNLEDEKTETKSKNTNQNTSLDKPFKITPNIIDEVNQDAKKYTKEKQTLELTDNEIKKIVEIEEIKNDKTSFYENFFVKNEEVIKCY